MYVLYLHYLLISFICIDEYRPTMANMEHKHGVGICTQEKFAESAGITLDTVRGLVRKGYLPTVKIGRYAMVNLVALNRELSKQSYEMEDMDWEA